MVSLSRERVSVVMETNDETPHEVWVLLTKLSKAHAYFKKSITSILDLQSQMKDSPENWCFGLCSLVQSLQIHRSHRAIVTSGRVHAQGNLWIQILLF